MATNNSQVPRLLRPEYFRLRPPASFQDNAVSAAGQDVPSSQSRQDSAAPGCSTAISAVLQDTRTSTTPAGQDRPPTSNPDSKAVQDSGSSLSLGLPPPSDHNKSVVRTRETPIARAAIERSLNSSSRSSAVKKKTRPPKLSQSQAGPQPTHQQDPHWTSKLEREKAKGLTEKRVQVVVSQALVEATASNRSSPTAAADSLHSSPCSEWACRGVGPSQQPEAEDELNNLDIDSNTVHPFPSHHHQPSPCNLHFDTVPGHQRSLSGHQRSLSGHPGRSDLEQNASNMTARDDSTVSDAQLAEILQEEEFSRDTHHHHHHNKPQRTHTGQYQPHRPEPNRHRPPRNVGGIFPPPTTVESGTYFPPGGRRLGSSPGGPPRRLGDPPEGRRLGGGLGGPPIHLGGHPGGSHGPGGPPRGAEWRGTAVKEPAVENDYLLAKFMQEEMDTESAQQLQERSGMHVNCTCAISYSLMQVTLCTHTGKQPRNCDPYGNGYHGNSYRGNGYHGNTHHGDRNGHNERTTTEDIGGVALWEATPPTHPAGVALWEATPPTHPAHQDPQIDMSYEVYNAILCSYV